jgi:hypothetical protein
MTDDSGAGSAARAYRTLPALDGFPVLSGAALLRADKESMEKPVRSAPWPAYDKGNVFVDHEDLHAPKQALENRLYFRYDHRPYDDTEAGRFEAALRRYLGWSTRSRSRRARPRSSWASCHSSSSPVRSSRAPGSRSRRRRARSCSPAAARS